MTRKLKCYIGGERDPFEHEFSEACFASNAKEAKKLMWEKGELSDMCEGSWIKARVIRKPDYDHLAEGDVPHLPRSNTVYRQMGWAVEGDRSCATCGIYEFDLQFPVCNECGQCCECGHENDCEGWG